jgi:uncharacterized membrane protein YkoI
MMFTKKLLAIFTVIMFMVPGTIAYAHGRNKDATAFFFLKKAAIDLPQVITSVEKEENGKVILFKLKEKKDTFQYKMKVLKDGKVFEAKVDSKSGKVLETESEGFFSRFSDEQEKAPLTTKLSLTDAISIVEKHYGGRALEGAFQENSSMKMFRIRMANNEGAFTVMVDADTGELFRVSSKDGRNHHDEEADE